LLAPFGVKKHTYGCLRFESLIIFQGSDRPYGLKVLSMSSLNVSQNRVSCQSILQDKVGVISVKDYISLDHKECGALFFVSLDIPVQIVDDAFFIVVPLHG